MPYSSSYQASHSVACGRVGRDAAVPIQQVLQVRLDLRGQLGIGLSCSSSKRRRYSGSSLLGPIDRRVERRLLDVART